MIQPVSGPETHNITPWNRREQRPKRALLERQTHHPAFHYGISDNSVWSERAFPMSDLHFLNSLLRFYFVKIKSRKTVSLLSEFSLKVSIWRCGRRNRKHTFVLSDDLSVVAKWIYYYMLKSMSQFTLFFIDRMFFGMSCISWIENWSILNFYRVVVCCG